MSSKNLKNHKTDYKIHDTHIHLDILLEKLNSLKEIESQLKNQEKPQEKQLFEQEDIEKIQEMLQSHNFAIQPTVSNQNFKKVIKNFESLKKVYFLVGSHPETVNNNFLVDEYLQEQTEILNTYKNNLKENRIIGIGECGLDYYYSQDLEIIKKQKQLFEAQIELAIDLKLPLIIHCREAFEDIYQILKNFPKIHGNFLIHCFTGDKNQLKQSLDLGGKVAFGGILTFGKNAEYLRESAKYCPDNSWVLETDSPFLSPNPNRGAICLPTYIDFVAEKMAEIKNISKIETWKISEQNTKNLFKNVKFSV